MKKHFVVISILTVAILTSCLTRSKTDFEKVNLRVSWDSIRPLENPHKGWYHHLLDNGIGKYLIQDDSLLYNFPGMDHLYLRLAWAYLEPEEGQYDWSYIDDIVEKYVPRGYGISFRISCKETGGAPNSLPVEIDGVGYATPHWVREAGAKGVVPSEYGPPVWTPDWNDPIYLEKLSNFHKAFAEKYDGKPWVRYVDVGSIGDWGEGHTHFSTRIPPTVDEIKANINIYLKHYKKTQIVVTDDLIYWNKSEDDVRELLDFVLENGITFRDDSPLVQYYMQNNMDTWTVSHAHFFDSVYKTEPTVFELEHYRAVKGNGYWLGKDGEKIIPEFGVSGAEIFRQAMDLIHPTYIGFHGYLGTWLKDNPNQTIQLLNRAGYWYFPVSFQIDKISKQGITFSMEWLNKGVAPAYHEYSVQGKLVAKENNTNTLHFKVDDAGNTNWMPDSIYLEQYNASFKNLKKGTYELHLRLFDDDTKEPVDLGLKIAGKDPDGYFYIQDFIIKKDF